MAAAARRRRCAWAGDRPLDVEYHDREWGVPSRDDRHLFEMLILEGAQAGLSWTTILNKREAYRRAYADFEVEKVARFTARKKASLMRDEGLVRNRLKIEASVENARAVLRLRTQEGSLSDFLWSFVDGKPIQHRPRSPRDVPTETEESRRLSKALKQRGFRFVGPTICYAFMQAVGMVNDHVVGCFRHAPVRRLGR